MRLLFGDEDETEGMDASAIAIQALVNVIGFEKGKESVKNVRVFYAID